MRGISKNMCSREKDRDRERQRDTERARQRERVKNITGGGCLHLHTKRYLCVVKQTALIKYYLRIANVGIIWIEQ